ncbi:hypothetical protein AB0K81_31645, partial [Streptomyces werraensis]
GMLLFDGTCGAGVRRLFDTTLEIRELARGGVDVDVGQFYGLGAQRMHPFLLMRIKSRYARGAMVSVSARR